MKLEKEHKAYLHRECTLDGYDAHVSTLEHNEPIIVKNDHTLGYKTSWVVVFNVIDNRNGKFSTTGEHG
jgi:hypothetical protein